MARVNNAIDAAVAGRAPIISKPPQALLKDMALLAKKTDDVAYYRSEMRQFVTWGRHNHELLKYLFERVGEIVAPLKDMGFHDRQGDMVAAALYVLGQGESSPESVVTMMTEAEEEPDLAAMKKILHLP